MSPKEEFKLSEAAAKYTEKIFKEEPDGFHVAPWVNEWVIAGAYEDGYRACYEKWKKVQSKIDKNNAYCSSDDAGYY